MAKSGEKIPRCLSLTLHGTRSNEVVHFDYFYMGASSTKVRYIFVIKNDLSSYIWLVPTKLADAEHAANSLSRWIRSFIAMNHWVSDHGSHFKNQTMELLANAHCIHHQFTMAYSPWVKVTVENVDRHVQAATRALSTDFKLGPHNWPDLAPSIQSILNEAPLKRL